MNVKIETRSLIKECEVFLASCDPFLNSFEQRIRRVSGYCYADCLLCINGEYFLNAHNMYL